VSTLGAQTVARLELTVPKHGSWTADVTLTDGVAPAGRADLVVGDLTMSGGTVVRSGLDAPGKPHVVLVGGAGWGRPLARTLSYQSDADVRLHSALKDLAVAADEPIELPADRSIDPHFEAHASTEREPVRIRDVLEALRRSGYAKPWRIDPDGVLRFGARVGGEVSGRATVMRQDASVGLTVLGVDSPAQFLPGATIDGTTIDRLVVRETGGKLTAEVRTVSPRLELLGAVASAFPALVYGYPRTYLIAGVDADLRLDLVPPPDATHLPELRAVEQWALGGVLVKPVVGREVGVVFRDANPARPVVAYWGPGSIDEIRMGDALGEFARYGETILVSPGNAGGPVTGVLSNVVGLGSPPTISKVIG